MIVSSDCEDSMSNGTSGILSGQTGASHKSESHYVTHRVTGDMFPTLVSRSIMVNITLDFTPKDFPFSNLQFFIQAYLIIIYNVHSVKVQQILKALDFVTIATLKAAISVHDQIVSISSYLRNFCLGHLVYIDKLNLFVI